MFVPGGVEVLDQVQYAPGLVEPGTLRLPAGFQAGRCGHLILMAAFYYAPFYPDGPESEQGKTVG